MKNFKDFKQENNISLNEANQFKVFDDYFHGDYLKYGNDFAIFLTRLADRNITKYVEMIGMIVNQMDIAIKQSKNNDSKLSNIINKFKDDLDKF